MARAAASMAKYANKHRRDITYHPGDRAWLKTDHLGLPANLSRKLSAKWTGPFTVEKVVNPVAVRLTLPANFRIHPVFHVSQLKPHQGPNVERPAAVMEDQHQAEEFEVEQILG